MRVPRPKRLVANRETLTEDMIGNGLRRILLRSIGGAAITAVRIEGVEHECSPIPGVVEDAKSNSLAFTIN